MLAKRSQEPGEGCMHTNHDVIAGSEGCKDKTEQWKRRLEAKTESKNCANMVIGAKKLGENEVLVGKKGVGPEFRNGCGIWCGKGLGYPTRQRDGSGTGVSDGTIYLPEC